MRNHLYIFGLQAAEVNTILLLFFITGLAILFYGSWKAYFRKIFRWWRYLSAFEVNQHLQKVLFNQSIYAVIAADIEGKILLFNDTAVNLFGYTQEEVLGKNISLLVPPKNRPKHEEAMKLWRETGYSNVVNNKDGVQLTAMRKDGTIFPMHIKIDELNEKGFKFIAGFIKNVGKELKEKHDIEARIKILDEGERIAQMGSWHWVLIPGKIVAVSKNFYNIFNIDEEDVVTSNDLMELVYPEDRQQMATIINEAVEKKRNYIGRYRRLQKDGSLKWIECRGELVFDDNHEVEEIIGTVQIINYELAGDT